ncbi:hypothetical protein [Couchioplanes caeruleus]|nr:hypothetical protein [Couchioplanes caeruleus]ROP28130.1 hypothetical protein EDD30_0839 [Couchioplanes caeruleus]
MFTRPVLVGLVAASVLLGAGCTSDKPKSTPTSAPTPSATPSLGPSAAAERDALIAYRGMWSAFVEAAKTSDPEAPDLNKYATGNALRLISSALYTNRSQDVVTLGELKIDPKVTALKPSDAPTEASVLDCVNDEKWLEHKKSGGLVNDKPGGKHRTTATVTLTADGWKVSRFVIGDESC